MSTRASTLNPGNTGGSTLNIVELIDKRKLSGLQWLTIALCALVTMVDGMDTQSIGIVARLAAQDIGFSMTSFSIVASAGLLGAAVGALSFGQLGDRFGRKVVLVAATATFGLFTIGTALSPSFEVLVVMRFLAGLGLGGAMPNMVAMSSEYAPKRIRSLLVTVQWSTFPLGGFLGGLAAQYILQHYSWHTVFYFGGGAGLVVAVLLLFLLPESLKYLIASNAPADRVRAIVNKMAPEAAGATTRFVTSEEQTSKGSVRQLFTEGRAPTTLLLWVIFAIAFAILVFTPLWIGALLGGQNGLTPPRIAFLVACNNFGSMIGGAIAGYLMDRYKSFGVLGPAFFLGALFTVGVGHGATMSYSMLAACISLSGFFMGFAGNGSVAVCAACYPTTLRATGMGWAVTMARAAQFGSSLLTGALLAASWTPIGIYAVTGGSAIIAGIAMITLKKRNPQTH